MTEFIETEPSYFEEAVKKLVWVDAMVEEYKSIVNNHVLEMVPRLADKSIVSSRSIFKVKHATDGSIEKYKAKFVAKGYYQVEGIYYDENFSHVVSDEKLIKSCKEDLAREFEMKDMGLMHYFLTLQVSQGNGELFVYQEKYANVILQIFCMESCKPMETPLVTNWRKEDATSGEEVDVTIYWQLVGSLMFLVNT
eukprot:PITA_31568